MNYLAHLYLSGNNEKIIVGNFIGDHIKGKNFKKYSPQIQKGILIHRKIDTFTDQHQLFRETKQFVKNEYGLYSGIIVDFYFDHILAKNWHLFSDSSLREFAKKIHAILLSNYFHLPKKIKGFLPFLIQNKRLESYQTIEGIAKSIKIMSQYTTLPDKTAIAIDILKNNYSQIEKNFFVFMNEIIEFIARSEKIEIKYPVFIADKNLR